MAIYIPNDVSVNGVNFFTSDELGIQIGFHNRKAYEKIEPHKHQPLDDVGKLEAQEAFYVKTGKIRVGLYNQQDTINHEITLTKGDILLVNCGHDITFLENSQIIEFKQGPYRGKQQEKEYINNSKKQ